MRLLKSFGINRYSTFIHHILFVLLLYNIYLSLTLLKASSLSKDCGNEKSNTSYFHLTLSNGRWDSRRMVKTFDNVIIAEQKPNGMVCLATQCSVDRLHSIVELANNWNGSISTAIYVAGEELYYLQDYVRFLRRCYRSIRQTVTFHLALPANQFPQSAQSGFTTDQLPCHQDPVTVLSNLMKLLPETLKRWRIRMPYPQNHLRNLARLNCQTHYTLVTDIDIIPSIDSAILLNTFLSERPKCLKCVYVLPTYEVHKSAIPPKNVTELIKLKSTGLARYFHMEVFKLNQMPTNFLMFEKSSKKYSGIHISHKVSKYQLYYEPFYVSLNNVPSYDERFIGYGYTRNSQVYEMFAAKYQFEVLANVFTFQHSFASQKKKSNYREIQYAENLALFTKFKKEIAARYLLSHYL
ncbi:beta-1,4-glucuronyltransferase 1-like [Rhopalosiphum padi]|uniref:beta-1,4-glucuronyltransferase 1-like n=1 Tax=Rhopalosiphum padi TaxID=40932 RepID=UPI00298EAB2B|nr:beta-1,4-glucuronyltransferase 1-like [Rhopalosiphum padi]XP_060842014.1 beta-1,4-glucuronyltransferase 1-like [Rhopalosiphum padi]